MLCDDCIHVVCHKFAGCWSPFVLMNCHYKLCLSQLRLAFLLKCIRVYFCRSFSKSSHKVNTQTENDCSTNLALLGLCAFCRQKSQAEIPDAYIITLTSCKRLKCIFHGSQMNVMAFWKNAKNRQSKWHYLLYSIEQMKWQKPNVSTFTKQILIPFRFHSNRNEKAKTRLNEKK